MSTSITSAASARSGGSDAGQQSSPLLGVNCYRTGTRVLAVGAPGACHDRSKVPLRNLAIAEASNVNRMKAIGESVGGHARSHLARLSAGGVLGKS